MTRMEKLFKAGFSVEAAKECLETGRDFYDRFPKDVNP